MASGAIALLSTYIAPVLLAFCGASFGPVCLGAGIVTAFCATTIISGIEAAVYMLAILIPSSIILTYMLKGKCAYRTAVIFCAVFAALATYINMFVPYFLEGYDVAYAVDAYIEPIVAQYNATVTVLSEDLMETAKMLTDTMLAYAMEIVFSSITLTGIAAGFLQAVLAYAFFRKKLELKKMAPFKKWQISTSFLWGSLIMLAAVFTASQVGVTYAGALAIVIELIIICPLVLIGVCCTEFFIQIIPENNGFRRIFIYGFAILSIPTSFIVFIITALADKLFKLRQRIIVIKKR